jgi:hypothetical protein
MSDMMFRPRLDRASGYGLLDMLFINPRGTTRKYTVEERFDGNKGMSTQNKKELNNAIKPAHDTIKIRPPKGLEKAYNTNKQNNIQSQKPVQTNLHKNSNGLVVAVTKDEAKKLGLNESTRITGKEESDMWKAIAKEQMKKKKW